MQIFLGQLMEIFQSWLVGGTGAGKGRCVEGGQFSRRSSLLSLVFRGMLHRLLFCSPTSDELTQISEVLIPPRPGVASFEDS